MINVLFLSFCHFTRTLYYHKGLAVHVLRPAKLLQSAADTRSVIALHVNTNLSLSAAWKYRLLYWVAYLATKTKFLPSTRRLHPLFIPAALHSSPTTKRQNSWSDPHSSQRAKTVTGRMRIKSSQNVQLHTDSRPIELPDSTRRRHFWAPQHASSKQGALWKTARKKGSQVARRGRQGLNSEYNQRRYSGQTWKWSR